MKRRDADIHTRNYSIRQLDITVYYGIFLSAEIFIWSNLLFFSLCLCIRLTTLSLNQVFPSSSFFFLEIFTFHLSVSLEFFYFQIFSLIHHSVKLMLTKDHVTQRT